jgi:hypothetical protein
MSLTRFVGGSYKRPQAVPIFVRPLSGSVRDATQNKQ